MFERFLFYSTFVNVCHCFWIWRLSFVLFERSFITFFHFFSSFFLITKIIILCQLLTSYFRQFESSIHLPRQQNIELFRHFCVVLDWDWEIWVFFTWPELLETCSLTLEGLILYFSCFATGTWCSSSSGVFKEKSTLLIKTLFLVSGFLWNEPFLDQCVETFWFYERDLPLSA